MWKGQDTSFWDPLRAAVKEHSDREVRAYWFNTSIGHLLCVRTWAMQNPTMDNRKGTLRWSSGTKYYSCGYWLLESFREQSHLSHHTIHTRVCLASFKHTKIKAAALLPWGYTTFSPPPAYTNCFPKDGWGLSVSPACHSFNLWTKDMPSGLNRV